MQLETLKDLEKLIKLCRKLGVDTIEVDNVKLQLGSEPMKSVKSLPLPIPHGEISADTKIQTPDDLTQEELLFYSAGGAQ